MLIQPLHPVSSLFNVLNYQLDQRVIAIPNLQDFSSLRSVTIDAVFRVRTFTHQSLVDYFTSPLPWIARLFTHMAQSSGLAENISDLTLNLMFARFPTNLLPLPDWRVLSVAVNKFPHPVRLAMNISGLDNEGVAILENDGRLSGSAWNGPLVITFQ